MLNKITKPFHWARTVVPLEKRNIFVVYAVILLGTVLDNLSSASALTLSANIQKQFNTDSSTTSWVLSGYALTLGSFIMVSGKISDVIGPHNLYLIGITIFWISALICACIPHTSIVALIVFRAIQGIGASTLIPSTIALTANYFTGPLQKHLNTAVIYMIVALTATLGLGVVLGGAFSETNVGYKGFFYFVFAYSFVVDVLLVFFIIPINKTDGHNKLKMKNIDFVAAFLVIAGCLLMILGLTEGGEKWRSPKAIAPLIIGFFTAASALVYEVLYIRRYQVLHQNEDKSSSWKLQVDLLFPPEILKIPNFYPFLIICGLYYATFVMIIAIGVYTYSLIYHDSNIITAVKVFPMSIGLVFGAIVYRDSYYKKVGYKRMFIISGVLSLVSIIWFSRTKFGTTNAYWKYDMGAFFLYGYGINIFFNIYMPLVIQCTPLHLQGNVNGIFQTCSQVLLSIGNALIPSIAGNLRIAYTFEEKLIIQNKIRTIFYVMMGFHAFIVILMVVAIKDPKTISSSDNNKDAINVENDNLENNGIDSNVDIEKLEKADNSESSIESCEMNKAASVECQTENLSTESKNTN
ncbi:hypothetical protein DAPK24_054450 [Pichia kluyveri]|uniref:Major facilitator superfamily (MFS) profile domain-containing protein n=1 Tax=Pichia kluyveri TaxID=36015 RepID=A0AAV5RD08_PICKL|nr:hypothetical protein DAPK24_054450 [Pichia kluyveri]